MDFPDPEPQERPTAYSDRLARIHSSTDSKASKNKLGQYFTSPEISRFMASLFDVHNAKESVYILDPGAGTGTLSCSLCEALAEKNNISKISLVAYEKDDRVLKHLEASLKHLKSWLLSKNVSLEYSIRKKDFILDCMASLINGNGLEPALSNFDLIISNPPYFKLPKSDKRVGLLNGTTSGQTNIYAIFMLVSASLLKNGGQMVFITPRSYLSGEYFKSFRKKLFSVVEPKTFHLFGSRNENFEREKVLQENVILKADRTPLNKDSKIIISFSSNGKDILQSKKRTVRFSDIVAHPEEKMILGLPASDEEHNVMRVFQSWNGSLEKYGFSISTGKVVPFRSRQFLAKNAEASNTHAPLLWMQNVKPMRMVFPEKLKKENTVRITKNSLSLLIENSNYVLLRRFSAKEDDKRLVAAPLLSGNLSSGLLGIENHVNYIYKKNGKMLPEEVYGLAALYNSGVFDMYFRVFNGNTQVGASEIKSIPLPSYDTILELGRHSMAGRPIEFVDAYLTKNLSKISERAVVMQRG